MEVIEIEVTDCPGCGHSMSVHHGHHCAACEVAGDECPAVDPASESEGG